MNHQTRIVEVFCAFLLALLTPAVAKAQEKSVVWVSEPNQLVLPGIRPADWFDQDNAVLYQSHALDLIRQTIGCQLKSGSTSGFSLTSPPTKLSGDLLVCTGGRETPTFPGPKDYVVIHVLRWKDPIRAQLPSPSISKTGTYFTTTARSTGMMVPTQRTIGSTAAKGYTCCTSTLIRQPARSI